MNPIPLNRSTSDDGNQNQSNPLLEGIRLANTEAELFPMIARDPFRNASWCKDNRDIDLFRLYLQQVVVPTKTILKGGLAIHRMLKVVLAQLNPKLKSNRLQYYKAGSDLVKSDFFRDVHEGMVCVGLTGTGKSHLIKATLSTVPQCIERANIAGLDQVIQVTWIYLDLTSVASVEAFAHRIVQEIDNALHSNGRLFELAFKGVHSAQAKMEAALRLLKTHFCAVIVIDEIQYENFGVATAAAMRSWILKIANAGIGIVFSGNPLGFKLQLPKKPKDHEIYSTQVLRRLFSSEEIRIDPAPSVHDANWQVFIKGINRCRLVGPPHPFDIELETLKFDETGGFDDFYVELHASMEEILAKAPKRVVDRELIRLAAKRSTKLRKMQPLISSFVHKDFMSLKLCSDVDHDYYQRLWTQDVDADVAGKAAVGSVGIVQTNTAAVDYAKSLEEDKKKAERRVAAAMNKERKETNPAAAAVRDHIMDGLKNMISGNSKRADKEP